MLAVWGNCSYLDQQWVSETQSTLQVLPEGIVQETGSGDLAIFVLIHYELCGLAWWINDQWIPGKGNSTELISMGYELNPRLIYAQEYFVMFLGFKKYYVRRKRYWPVEPLEHDGILSAEIISWEGVGLPAEPLISIGQILSSGNVCTELCGTKVMPIRY